MKSEKILMTLLGLLAVNFLIAQTDTTVVSINLPKTFDFSTVAGFTKTVSLLLSAALTIVSGFWAKGNDFLKKWLPTTEKRVAFVGFIVSLGVGLTFGFSQGVLTTIWTSLLGVFVGMGAYGTVKAQVKTEEKTPIGESSEL